MRLYLIRAKDGKIEIRGVNPKTSASDSSAAAPAVFGINVDFIQIRDGTVRFVDMMGDEPSDITIKKLDADITDIFATAPVKFSIKMTLASERQNVILSGIFSRSLTGSLLLKDLRIEADLTAFGYADILKALPSLKKAGLKEAPAGKLKAYIRELKMSDGKLSALSGDLSVTDGRLVLSRIRVPIEKITLDVNAQATTIRLRSFSAQLVNGVLSGSATIDDFLTVPHTKFKLAAEARGFHEFLSTAAAVKQNLDGNARIAFSGEMAGRTWPEMSKNLTGLGTLSLDNGIIMNANVFDQTVGALTVFPNLVNTLQGNVSPPVQKVLGETYTVLKPLNQTFSVEGGYFIVPDLTLRSDYIDMSGNAKMSFTGDLSGSGIIRFAPSISASMLAAVPQMRAITDAQGLVTFPIDFKGGSGAFKVIPDMKYIGRKIAVETAGDVVSGYLKKATEAKDTAQGQSPNPTKPPKIKDFLKALAEEAEKSK
jgi:hypothetical protein